MKIRELYDFIDRIAPYSLQMDFDNSGLMVGDMDDDFHRVILALDVTDAVIDEALAKKADLILTHHPIIFNPVKRIGSKSVLYKLIRSGIKCISAHTNLDIAAGGVNTCLAEAIGLNNIKYTGVECLYIGELDKELDDAEFAVKVRNALGCKGLRYTHTGKKIKTVAVSSGAGGSSLYDAAHFGADALVTGEIKHHEIMDSAKLGICIVDAGHYKSEDVVFYPLINSLRTEFPDIDFIKSESFTDGVDYV